METKSTYKEYNIHVIEVEDEDLFYLFGTDGDHESMDIDNETLPFLEDYLLEEDEEDGSCRMEDEDVQALFNYIKESLKTYPKISVRLSE